MKKDETLLQSGVSWKEHWHSLRAGRGSVEKRLGAAAGGRSCEARVPASQATQALALGRVFVHGNVAVWGIWLWKRHASYVVCGA